MVIEVTLSADLRNQVEQERVSGRYRRPNELIEQALRQFFDERRVVASAVLDALRRIGRAVDHAGLYESVPVPS